MHHVGGSNPDGVNPRVGHGLFPVFDGLEKAKVLNSALAPGGIDISTDNQLRLHITIGK
jgi:hypothetical protein